MKISNSQQLNRPIAYSQNRRNEHSNQPSFKGIANFFRFLSDDPVWGATLVDTGSMVVPRTGTDMCSRGINAGLETGFRESCSLTNDSAIGLYGVAAGALIAGSINKKYGIKAKNIFASDEAAEMFTTKWQKHNGNVDNYINDFVDNLHAYTPEAENNIKGYTKISEGHKQGIAEDLKYLINGDRSKMHHRWKEVKDRLPARVLEATGTENGLKLIHKDASGEKSIIGSSKSLFEDFYRVTEALSSEKAAGKSAELLNDYKKFGKTRTALGIALASSLALSFQPLNVYMSKKRTGSDGFVGVEGRSKDKSTRFKVIKGLFAAGVITGALASMGALSKNVKQIPKLFLDKNLYKGKSPTINQFKTIYGITIASRIISSRDKDELRETVIKDTLGFVNWLILGNIVTQCILKKTNPKLLKISPDVLNGTDKMYNKLGKYGKKFYKLLTSSIVSHKEIVMEGIKKERPDIKSIINNGNTMTFNQMVKALPKNGEARKALSIRNKAQLGGYLYSGIVLGLGVPNLNIWLTNHIDKKRKAKLAAAQAAQASQTTQQRTTPLHNLPKDKTVFKQMHHLKAS